LLGVGSAYVASTQGSGLLKQSMAGVARMVQDAGSVPGNPPFSYPATLFSTFLKKKLGRFLLLTINERNIAAFLVTFATKNKLRL
jgi:hypothetical protein